MLLLKGKRMYSVVLAMRRDQEDTFRLFITVPKSTGVLTEYAVTSFSNCSVLLFTATFTGVHLYKQRDLR